ncbi:MAG: cytochrome c [Mesorhizobium sp.]|nr:cytochrome c [Mesorhizobium sp.]
MERRTLRLAAARVATSAVLAATSGPAFADAAAGKKLAQQRCAVCHGVDGLAKMPIAPHLAGENEVYIQTQLKAFRTGKRVHEMMSVVAKELSDDQIADLAAWYASIKITVTMPP